MAVCPCARVGVLVEPALMKPSYASVLERRKKGVAKSQWVGSESWLELVGQNGMEW